MSMSSSDDAESVEDGQRGLVLWVVGQGVWSVRTFILLWAQHVFILIIVV